MCYSEEARCEDCENLIESSTSGRRLEMEKCWYFSKLCGLSSITLQIRKVVSYLEFSFPFFIILHCHLQSGIFRSYINLVGCLEFSGVRSDSGHAKPVIKVYLFAISII